MRNLLRVTTRSSCGIIELTTRLFANYGSRRFSNEGKKSTDKAVEGGDAADEQSRLAVGSIRGYRQSKTINNFLRIMDKTTAKKFADMITSSPVDDPLYVIEISPGLGFLTEALLNAGIPTLNLFEDVEYYNTILKSIEKKYPNRVNLKTVDFKYLWYMSYNDWKNGTNLLHEFLDELDTRPWKDKPVFHIIGALRTKDSLRRYMGAMIFRHSLAKYGRAVFHLAIPNSLWIQLSSQKDNYHFYTSGTVMFQILFRYELIGTLPRVAFQPKHRNKSNRYFAWRQHQKNDGKSLCVVRLEARNDLFNDDFTENDIRGLYVFVKHHFRRRKNRIIPELEKWIPGCGRTLIKEGYRIDVQFGHLLPNEVIKLFLLFKSLPGYSGSAFLSMMDSFPVRIDEEIAFSTNSDKVEELFRTSRELVNARAALNDSEENSSTDSDNV